MNTIPETIENRWDIFYRDFPEIYDRFGRIPKTPTAIEFVSQNFPLTGKTVLDVGSGTGLSTFELAQYSSFVTGVEPEDAMRQIALRVAEAQHITNVRFLPGWAEALPLDDRSVDMVIAVTLASLHNEANINAFVSEAERVVRRGGLVLTIDLAPGWYGGELAPIILQKPREQMDLTATEVIFPKHGYQVLDFFASQDYGSVENAVQTYGFIFGKRAIDYLREHQKSVIQWKIRIHHKTIQ
jgi:ubiquinone/menaquinone biosynthesis C-methylase UbiE